MENVKAPTKNHVGRRTSKTTPRAKYPEPERTPESQLMTVEEYFGILHKMIDEYYDSIQG